MAQGPSDTILVAIRITLWIRESKGRNPDPPDRQRFVLSEHIVFLFATLFIRRQATRFSQMTLRTCYNKSKCLQHCGKAEFIDKMLTFNTL